MNNLKIALTVCSIICEFFKVQSLKYILNRPLELFLTFSKNIFKFIKFECLLWEKSKSERMSYFDELEKNIVYYLKTSEIRNKSKNKKRAKTNKFFRKVECWNCNAFFHKVVLTKYHGILCKKCYREECEKAKSIFLDFIASFEVEYDTDFEEDLEKLSDIFEMVHDFYEGCSYRLKNEEPKVEYKEIVQIAKKIYDTLENQNVK